MVVEGSQEVGRHGVRSWCGVVGGTWQRFPEMASENEQRLMGRSVSLNLFFFYAKSLSTRQARTRTPVDRRLA